MLQELMHGIGTVLDAPRSLLYKGLNAGADALGGDPSHEWKGFGDVLESAGMDQDSMLTKALGFAGDVATDPLTWAGAGAAKFLRGKIPGVTTAVGRGAATGEGLAAGKTARNLLKDTTVFRDVTPAVAESGFGGYVDPLTREVAGVASSGPAGLKVEGRIAAQPAAQRQGLREELKAGEFGKTSEGAISKLEGNAPVNGLGNFNFDGMYASGGNSIALTPSATTATKRHELVHAMIDNAAKTGQADDLPFLMRLPAKMKAGAYQEGRESAALAHKAAAIGDNAAVETANAATARVFHTPKQALAMHLDELAAHSLQGRSTGEKIQGAMGYLFNPQRNAAYRDYYAPYSPGVAKLYGSLPAAFVGAGAAAGGATGALGRALE
jgi:hypothetical protein